MNPQNTQAETGNTDSEESNEKHVAEEANRSKVPEQKIQSVEDSLTKIIQTNKITEDTNTEQVPQNTDVPVDSVGEGQIQNNESITSVAPDKNEESGNSQIFDAIQKITQPQGDIPAEPATGKISEAIHKMTQPPADLPEQSTTMEKSTFDTASSLPEVCANDIMQKKVTWASPQDSLQQAIAKMQQTNSGYIMVGQNGALEGIVSKSDITKAMSPFLLPMFAKWRRPLDDATLKIRIKWIMSRPVRTIKPQTSLAAIIEHLSQFRGRCLPVMDEEGNVQGIVTGFDIFQTLLKHKSNICSIEEAPQELVETASSTETT